MDGLTEQRKKINQPQAAEVPGCFFTICMNSNHLYSSALK